MNTSSCHSVASLQELCVQTVLAQVDHRTVRESQNAPPCSSPPKKGGLTELLQKVDELNPYVGFSDHVKNDLSRENYLALRETCERLLDVRPYLVLEESKKLNSYERVNDELLKELPSNTHTLVLGPNAQVVKPAYRKDCQLEVLRLQSCPVLKELDARQLKHVKVLSVSDCPKLEKVSLACQSLAELKLSGCPSLTSLNVEEQENAPPAMVALNDLNQLSEVDLSKARNLPRLDYRNCPRLSVRGVKQSPGGNVLVPKNPYAPPRKAEKYLTRRNVAHLRRTR